jgi:hypothetical protein
VEDYLRDLERCAARLPRRQRGELLAELREHLDAGVDEGASEAEIRNLLDALGTPAEIVEEAAPRSSSAGPTGRLALGFGIASLLLLVAIGVFAVPFGVTAIVLGLRARRHLRTVGLPTATATGAVVTGTISVLIPLVVFLLLVPTRDHSSSDSEPDGGRPVPTTAAVG